MDKEFTLEEVLKAAEMHTNGTCDGTCPLESMEIDCEDTFAETVLELNKKNENLSAENKQLQLAIERKDKRLEKAHNELILEKAKSEELIKENEDLRRSLYEALNGNGERKRVKELTEEVSNLNNIISKFEKLLKDIYENMFSERQKAMWVIGIEHVEIMDLISENNIKKFKRNEENKS